MMFACDLGQASKAMSTRSRVFSKTHIFFSRREKNLRPHVQRLEKNLRPHENA